MSLVVIDRLGKRYGGFEALRDCSFEIKAGEIFGLLGPNGAGKTTLMRCLLGFLRSTSGRATIGGWDCWSERTGAHRCLTYMPAQPQLPRLMRARDVLRFFADIRPREGAVFKSSGSEAATWSPRYEATERYQQACQLAERLQLDLSRWVALMSTGMRQKLAIAATLCADAPLVFLDEPTANLDPDVRSQLLHELAELRQRGTTIVFSSHVLSEIEQVCDRVAVLAKGECVGLSEMAALKRTRLIRWWQPDAVPGESDGHVLSTLEGEPIRSESNGYWSWQTSQPLEVVLPGLLTRGVQDLQVHSVGLLDVYHQHLSYSRPAQGEGVEV